MKQKESDIQRLITDWLTANRIWWMRCNSGQMLGSHKGKKWCVRFGRRGMADIMAVRVIQGGLQIIWIEVKTATGEMSDDQRAFRIEVESQDMHYILARSLEDVSGIVA